MQSSSSRFFFFFEWKTTFSTLVKLHDLRITITWHFGYAWKRGFEGVSCPPAKLTRMPRSVFVTKIILPLEFFFLRSDKKFSGFRFIESFLLETFLCPGGGGKLFSFDLKLLIGEVPVWKTQWFQCLIDFRVWLIWTPPSVDLIKLGSPENFPWKRVVITNHGNLGKYFLINFVYAVPPKSTNLRLIIFVKVIV